MADDRLPPHITEDDLRLITKIVLPTIAAEAIRGLARKCYNGAPGKYQEFYDRGIGQWLHTEADMIEYLGPLRSDSAP